MSLAILAKKSRALQNVSSGRDFRVGPPTVNSSRLLDRRTRAKPQTWKPVQNQAQSERLHKDMVNYAKCWTVQTEDNLPDCGDDSGNSGNSSCKRKLTIYKDMRTQSAGEYLSVFESARTCYALEPKPTNNTCS